VEVVEEPILDQLQLSLIQEDLEVQEVEVHKLMEEGALEMLEDTHHQKEIMEEVQEITFQILILEEEVVEQVE
jgi:hypothetical protein